MEFSTFKKFNGSLTVHFFTDNLQVYALDGCEKAIQMWNAYSDDDKKYFVAKEWEKQNKKLENEIIGEILDNYDKYNF